MAAVRTFVLPHYEAYPVHVALFSDVKNAEFLRSQLLAANPEFDYAFIDAAMILTPRHLLAATTHTLHAFLHATPKSPSPHGELIYRLSPGTNIGEAYKLFGISAVSTDVVVVKLPNGLRGGGKTESNTGASKVEEEKEPQTPTQENLQSQTQQISSFLAHAIHGTNIPIGPQGHPLGDACAVHRLKKVYKVGCANAGKAGKPGKLGKAGKENPRAAKAGDGDVGMGGQEGAQDDDKTDSKADRSHIEAVVLGCMALKGQ